MNAPPDRCPLCLNGPFPPRRTTSDQESVTGHYWCPGCRRKWTCCWLLSALKEAA